MRTERASGITALMLRSAGAIAVVPGRGKSHTARAKSAGDVYDVVRRTRLAQPRQMRLQGRLAHVQAACVRLQWSACNARTSGPKGPGGC